MESEQNSPCSELAEYSQRLLLSHKAFHEQKALGKLKLFGSLSLPGRGGLVFVGGRVSVLKWHPTAKGILATAAHRSEQLSHEVLTIYSGAAHIQIWRISGSTAACLGVVPHDGDCTWDLKWRPGRATVGHANTWSGTFAAALGNGCILISSFDNATQNTSGYDSLTGQVRVLPHSKTLLNVHKKPFLRRPVRVLEWSLNGSRLLVGSVNGFVEVYEASSDSSVWPKWTIPAQESIVSDIKWLNPFLFCTLGISCVLRLRDIRDPVATIEQNAEGLAGSLSMSMAEPNIAVVGSDTGYLRVVRLRGTDNFKARHPVRRVYVQGSSFRTMQSISVPSPRGSRTFLYTGGCEGIVHEISFPRPLWPDQDQCTISRTKVGHLLRWCVVKSPAKTTDTSDMLHLVIGDGFQGVGDTGKDTFSCHEPVDAGKIRSQSDFRKKTKVVGPHTTDTPLFGDSYHQTIVITRVDLSIQDGTIAVGIDGGIITWLPLGHENIDSSLAADKPSASLTKQTASSKKRMRPKKPLKPNVKEIPPKVTIDKHRNDSPVQRFGMDLGLLPVHSSIREPSSNGKSKPTTATASECKHGTQIQLRIQCRLRIRARVEGEASRRPQESEHVRSTRRRKRLRMSEIQTVPSGFEQERPSRRLGKAMLPNAKKRRPSPSSFPQGETDTQREKRKSKKDPVATPLSQSGRDVLRVGDDSNRHDAVRNSPDRTASGRPKRNRSLTWRMRGD